MRTRLLILSLLLPSLAWSQAWPDFKPAYKPFPCQDGWMACIQDSNHVEPGLTDAGTAAGPGLAHLRIGWFDLKPTTNFTPFSGFSEYTGAEPARRGAVAVNTIGDTPKPGEVASNDPNVTGDPPPNVDPNGNDAVAAVDSLVDPEAERARAEASQRALEEAQSREAAKAAAAETERAKAEAKLLQDEADKRAKSAALALQAVEKAKNDAEKAQLKAKADQMKADNLKAQKDAQEAAKLQLQRETAEAKSRADAQRAAAAAKTADEERKRTEAAEARKAEAVRKAEADQRQRDEAAAKKAADDARRAADAAAAKEVAAAQKAADEARAKAAAAKNDAERQRLEQERLVAEEARKKAAADAKRAADEAVAKAAATAKADAERAAKEREQERLRKQEEERARIAAEQQAKSAANPQTVVAVEQDGGAGCANTSALEPKAALGKLDAGTVQCLEASLAASSKQTDRSRISRLLMSNAFGSGSTSDWEDLMKRHLETIDQSDPDLCYKYALQLARKGPGSAWGVLKWADIALENRSVWTGSTYSTRVHSLYKVKATAANGLWQAAEKAHSGAPTEESNEKVKDARNRTKVYARDWYEYAKAIGKEVDTPLALCESAAGTKSYCEVN